MKSSTDGVSNLARGIGYLLVSQVSTRLVTFFLNQGVVWLITPEEYGLLTVQLPLLTTTILFISREGFRRGCLRSQAATQQGDEAEDQKRELHSILSVSVWCIVWGTLVMGAFTSLAVLWPGAAMNPDVLHCYVWHGVACLVELLAEPLYICSQSQLQWRLRAGIDGAAAITRCSLLLGLLWKSSLGRPLVFSISQMSYALATLLGYLLYAWRLSKTVPIVFWMKWGAAEKERARLTATFTAQAVGKQALQEASKVALVSSNSSGLYDQGVYGLVSNLGSLVVRVLLQPVEESAFTHFSLVNVQDGDKAALEQVSALLRVLLRAMSVVGLLAVSFGPAYSFTALNILYGSKWSSTAAPQLLSLYCPYIFVLALNGVTEAFVHAVLDRKRLLQSNIWLVLSFALHTCLSIVLIQKYSTSGLVVADTINMVLRIATSLWYIKVYFKQLPTFTLLSLAPRLPTWLACAAAAAVVHTSKQHFLHKTLLHIGVGGATLALLLAVLYFTERSSFRQLRSLRQSRTPRPKHE